MSAEEAPMALGAPLGEPSYRTKIGNALYEYAHWPPDQINYYLDQFEAEHASELAQGILDSDIGQCCDECKTAAWLAARLISAAVADED